MASPNDTFKSSLFGQLKSYSTAVQGVFEQRIARPLLAFKRDLSRPTSETRVPNEQEYLSANRTRQESTSSSSPLEIIDIDTSGSFRTIFDKVKNTLSPSIKRRTSENPNNNNTNTNDERKYSSEENHKSTDIKTSKPRLNHRKSVSFADNIENDNDSEQFNHQYSIDDQYEIVRNAQTLADQILISSINEATTKTKTKNILSTKYNDDDDEFQREFHQTIKPRRILDDNQEDFVYQDLSAEIVAYILKHALRTLKKEQEELIITSTNKENNNNEDDDFIDLK